MVIFNIDLEVLNQVIISQNSKATLFEIDIPNFLSVQNETNPFVIDNFKNNFLEILYTSINRNNDYGYEIERIKLLFKNFIQEVYNQIFKDKNIDEDISYNFIVPVDMSMKNKLLFNDVILYSNLTNYKIINKIFFYNCGIKDSKYLLITHGSDYEIGCIYEQSDNLVTCTDTTAIIKHSVENICKKIYFHKKTPKETKEFICKNSKVINDISFKNDYQLVIFTNNDSLKISLDQDFFEELFNDYHFEFLNQISFLISQGLNVYLDYDDDCYILTFLKEKYQIKQIYTYKLKKDNSLEPKAFENIDNLIFIRSSLSTIGFKSSGDIFVPVISKGTHLPVSKSIVFTTNNTYQKNIMISVYEGEKTQATQNDLLNNYVIEHIKSIVAGKEQIKVTFTINSLGLLEIDAFDLTKKCSKKIRTI